MGAEFLATALPSTTSSDRPPYFSHLTALNLRKYSYSLKNPVQTKCILKLTNQIKSKRTTSNEEFA
jgi:hypothetical protein